MTKIIILNNKKCQIVSDNPVILKRLHNHLSFKMAGVEFTPAFQNGWSGITYLMNKTNKFDIGLLNKVKNFLTQHECDFIIEDLRAPKVIESELDISHNLTKHGFIPREHQVRIADLVYTHDRGIVRAVTSAGKTLATALMAAKINKPTIIYVIGLDLLGQFHRLFSKLFDEKIGYIGDGVCNIQRINIASIWTIGKALSMDDKIIMDEEFISSEKEMKQSNYAKIFKLLKEVKLHIFDESHICTCSTISEIYKNIDPEYIYGFSGTPFRDDGSDLIINGILGEQIIDISATELIEKNLLTVPLIKFITVPKIPLSGDQYQTVYKEYIVENEIRNNLIVDHIKDLLSKNYTPLILFKQIKHGNILFDKLTEAEVKFEMLSGNDSLEKRDEVKAKLVNKEINLILASTIFDIGLDIPELNALVLCGGGKSSIRSKQRIGRVIRLYPGKKFAAVIDFYDQAKFLKKHSTIRYQTYCSEKGFKVFKSKEMK